jgi:hypothetical protein
VAQVVGRLQGGIAGRLVSPGFESNDAGFQRNADWLLAALDWKYQVYRPGRFIRRWSIGSDQAGVGWTFAGRRRAALANLTGNLELRSFWGGTLSVNREFSALDPEVLRGGPALLLPHRDRAVLRVHSDSRRRWLGTVAVSGEWEPATGSHRTAVTPTLDAFVTDRLQIGLGPTVSAGVEAWQYVDQAADGAGTTRFVLGRLDQTTASLTTRVTYAFSSHLTLQMYSQAFLSGGRYDAFKEVVQPEGERAADRVSVLSASRLSYDSASRRFTVDAGQSRQFGFADPGFSKRDFHLNLLMRWEFLPGSTLFLVWTHQKSSRVVAPFQLDRDLDRLWHAPGINALAAKVSYWIGV